jgi:hypothetical protein
MNFPVFSQLARKLGFRDEFAPDCLLQQRVMRTRDFKADRGLHKPIAHRHFAGSHCCKMPLLVQRR